MQEGFERIRNISPAARPVIVPLTSPEWAAHTGVQRVRIGGFTVPRGAAWVVPNPMPLVLKLFSAAGVQLPVDSRVILAKRRIPEDHPEFLAMVLYGHYFSMTEAQQRNAEFYSQILVRLSPLRVGSQIDGIRFGQEERLDIFLESSATVNLAVAGTIVEFPVGVDNSNV